MLLEQMSLLHDKKGNHMNLLGNHQQCELLMILGLANLKGVNAQHKGVCEMHIYDQLDQQLIPFQGQIRLRLSNHIGDTR